VALQALEFYFLNVSAAYMLIAVRVTRKLEKNCQIFVEIAQKVAMSKKAKISTTKLNSKARNIYNKPLLKP